MMETQELIRVTRYKYYKKDIRRIANWMKKIGMKRIEVSKDSAISRWKVSAISTVLQLTKFIIIEAEYESGNTK